MELKILLEHASAAASALPPHCHVSLPIPVAASLSDMRPFASLVILKLTSCPPRGLAALTSTTPLHAPIFVAWAGTTTPHLQRLGVHPRFAALLGLPDAHLVSAAVVERVVENAPAHPATNILLRPASYTRCPPRPTPDAAADAVFDAALADFTALSSAAGTLERTILAHLRVVYIGLRFPLQLPAREVVEVCVMHVKVEGGNDDDAELEAEGYAVLMPDSEVHIEAPPVRMSGKGEREKVKAFYRVLAPRRDLSRALPERYARTHAVLCGARGGAQELGVADDEGYALVCLKGKGKQLALPTAFVRHAAVPPGHVWLPFAMWVRLRLTPLSVVFVEEVPPFPLASSDLLVAVIHGTDSPYLPSIEHFIAAHGVYYDGMLLRNMRVHVQNDDREATALELFDRPAPWDGTIAEADDAAKSATPTQSIDVISDAFPEESKQSADSIELASQNRVVRPGFRSFPEQQVTNAELSDIPRAASSALTSALAEFSREKDCRKALMTLRECARRTLSRLMRLARPLRSYNAGTSKSLQQPRCVVLQGGVGTGKTHVSRIFASLLQERARLRTIWIRCKAHAGEKTSASARRITEAFSAARDGGPGLIVLDDFDVMLSTRKTQREAQSDEADEKINQKRQACAWEFREQMSILRSEGVLVLITCQTAKRLPLELRSPGLLSAVMDLPLPNATERAFLYWTALVDDKFLSKAIDSTDPRSKTQVAAFGNLSEGYSPKDVHVSLRRACLSVATSRAGDETSNFARFTNALEDTLKAMEPAVRSGIRFSETNPGELLSWASIGALQKATDHIKDALQLPSKRPDVFSNAPIRLPHGILLYGPPGCGKTLLARTAVFECSMRCVMVKGPELLSKYIGESEAEVRRAFEKAAKSAPCVLLFDEFDSLAPRRGGESTGVADRVVNTLLTCMDGAERLSEGVYVLATTSRPELIDPALLRPGRLDRWIPVDIPSTESERLDILTRLCRRFFEITPALQTDLEQLAEKTDGYTGADLGAILNDAHLIYKKLANKSLGQKSVSDALSQAHHQSRPSLSKTQRDYFQNLMRRFAPAESAANGRLPQDVLKELGDGYGRKTALQ